MAKTAKSEKPFNGLKPTQGSAISKPQIRLLANSVSHSTLSIPDASTSKCELYSIITGWLKAAGVELSAVHFEKFDPADERVKQWEQHFSELFK